MVLDLFMKYINILVTNLASSSWFTKLVFSFLAYVAPISTAVTALLVLIGLDLITKVYLILKEKPGCFRWSRLVRGVMEKTAAYLTVIISLHILQVSIMKDVFDFTTIAIGLIASGEVSSTIDNMWKITKNDGLLRIKDKINGWFKNKL